VLPLLPFMLVGGGLLIVGQRIGKNNANTAKEEATAVETAKKPDASEMLLAEMRVDPLELALATDLVDHGRRRGWRTCWTGVAARDVSARSHSRWSIV
jgi:hypothetical protein